MKTTRHVGTGDDVEHRVVVTEAPYAETLTQIRVEIHSHHGCQPMLMPLRPSPSALPKWHHRCVSRDDVLITATELARRMAAGEPLAILDVRWQLAEPDGRAAYEQGHLPGAVYVSLEDELSDHNVTGRGRHPLPTGRSVEAAARWWGVRTGVAVVVYDDWNRPGPGRAGGGVDGAGHPDVPTPGGGP